MKDQWKKRLIAALTVCALAVPFAQTVAWSEESGSDSGSHEEHSSSESRDDEPRVDPTRVPIIQTSAPEQPTRAPEQPTNAPDTPTTPPDTPTQAPDTPTDAPRTHAPSSTPTPDDDDGRHTWQSTVPPEATREPSSNAQPTPTTVPLPRTLTWNEMGSESHPYENLLANLQTETVITDDGITFSPIEGGYQLSGTASASGLIGLNPAEVLSPRDYPNAPVVATLRAERTYLLIGVQMVYSRGSDPTTYMINACAYSPDYAEGVLITPSEDLYVKQFRVAYEAGAHDESYTAALISFGRTLEYLPYGGNTAQADELPDVVDVPVGVNAEQIPMTNLLNNQLNVETEQSGVIYRSLEQGEYAFSGSAESSGSFLLNGEPDVTLAAGHTYLLTDAAMQLEGGVADVLRGNPDIAGLAITPNRDLAVLQFRAGYSRGELNADIVLQPMLCLLPNAISQ